MPIYPNVSSYYLKCPSVPKLQYINGHIQLNLALICSVAPPCAPPTQVCRFQSQCWHVPWRTHPVWLIHQPSVFLRFRTRGLRWATGIHWDPDCNEMPCLALYLADVVWFSPNVKTRFKMVQNKQYAVIRYFPYTTEKIHTPYLYHQESRNISHLTQTPSFYS